MKFLAKMLMALQATSSTASWAASPPRIHAREDTSNLSAQSSHNAPTLYCYTEMGTVRLPTPINTLWSTRYLPCTATLTTTLVTVQPPLQGPSTSIFTSTSTMTNNINNIPVATITVESTSTFTVTATATVTAISTSTQRYGMTWTNTAPAGWVPVQSSFPGAMYAGWGGEIPVVASKNDGLKVKVAPGEGKPKLDQGISPNVYPKAVVCDTWEPGTENCITDTVRTTVTVTTPPLPPVISTRTSVLSNTTGATSTTICTANVQETITSTIIETFSTATTVLAVVATTTVYAACATDNFSDMHIGKGIGNLIPSADNIQYDADRFSGTTLLDPANAMVLQYINVTDAYACCVAALLDHDQAQVFAFVPSSKQCIIIAQSFGGVCEQQLGVFYAKAESEPLAVVGNGACGQVLPPPLDSGLG